jgi:hypothetical protein
MPGSRDTAVVDEDTRVSYLLVAGATPVYASGGEPVGKVKQVMCEPAADIFDGLLVATTDGDRYIPAEQVAAIHEHGVELSITPAAVASLPAPRHHPRVTWDLERPPVHVWDEIEDWLLEHLPHGHPARDARIRLAQERLTARRRAVKLAKENPQLAAEVGVGRPDLPGSDHGGVIDINHAPAGAIATLPGLDQSLAQQIADARGRIAGFASLEDLGMMLDLPGDIVEHLRDRVVFLPD